MSELVEKLGISKQAVSQLVDDLVARGLLERKPDPVDARAKVVLFTDAGKRSLFDGLAELHALQQEMQAQLGKARMDALHGTLIALHDWLQEGEPET